MMQKHELFSEFQQHLMKDNRPSDYFNEWLKSKRDVQEYPFSMLTDLTGIEQSPQHHPEGSVWNHTMMVVDNAALRREQSEDPRAFMWAALLHDLGKATTTKVRKGKITSYDHDRVGAELAANFLKVFTDENNFIERVTKLVRWHMQLLFVVKDLPFADLARMTSEVTIDEMALLSLCDRLGRGGLSLEKRKEECENIRQFLIKGEEYLIKQGLDYAARPIEFYCPTSSNEQVRPS